MTNDIIHFGVIGLGVGMGRCKFVHECPRARLVAVSDLLEDRGRKAEEQFATEWMPNYQDLIARDDIDVVMIMTPSGMHAAMGMEVADAGKHVVTTKPIDIKLGPIDALIAKADACGVRLVTDYNFRYLGNNVLIKESLAAGRLGDLIFGEARLKWWRPESYFDDWHGTWEMDGGGSLMNQTVHQVDLLQWYMGDVESVVGKTGIYAHTNIETEDVGMALVKFKSGAMGMILGTTTYPVKNVEPTIELHGTKGAVTTARGTLTTWQSEDGFDPASYDYTGPTNIVEDVCGMLLDGKEPFCTAPDARKAVEIVLAIYESAQTGREVFLPL